ncbi:hypothetical protein C8R43DRAFT_850829, partial [Mycena crocata]
LNSNDVPLDSEIPSICSLLSKEEHRVEALDARIVNMRAALKVLTQRRNEAAESLRQHLAILSPIRRMPPELICEIFAWLTAQYEGALWNLGSVCRPWRHSALSYPQLW